MDGLQLNHDEYHLFLALPDDGSGLGNTSLRAALGWNKARYGRAKDGLIEHKIAIRGIEYGGTLRRAPIVSESEIDVNPSLQIATIGPLVAEQKMYGPILDTLTGQWCEERSFSPLAIETIANGGRRDTGGRWSRPGLVAVGIKQFEYVPDKLFEIVTFEVKIKSQISVVAVYEALSHRRRATHAYVLLEVPAVLEEALQEDIGRVQNCADEHGIGVITFSDPAEFETWNELIPATRIEAGPEQRTEFIRNQLSFTGQNKIADYLYPNRHTTKAVTDPSFSSGPVGETES